jgi:hypothetical protein
LRLVGSGGVENANARQIDPGFYLPSSIAPICVKHRLEANTGHPREYPIGF